MKRLTWLRNLGLSAASIAAVTPVIITTTSCTVTSYYVDEFVFDFQKIHEGEDFDTKNVKHYSTSFNSLLYGSKKYHNGNYVLFVGTATNASTAKFLGTETRTREQWMENFNLSPFYTAVKDVYTHEDAYSQGIKDCGFYEFIDFFDGVVKDKKGHELSYSEKDGVKLDNIGPFVKWTQASINQTKSLTKTELGYDWDETSVTKDKDYVRQDESAIAYREMVKRGLALYPVNDKRKKENTFDAETGAPKMLVFKDGVLQEIKAMPDGNIGSITDFTTNVIIKNYKNKTDEKK